MKPHCARLRQLFAVVMFAVVIVVLCGLGGGIIASAQEPTDLPESVTLQTASHDDVDMPTQEKQRRQAMAGLLILGLVCFVGIMLVVVVVLWAGRLRRMNDEPLPKQHPGDPLWYLRKGTRQTPASNDERQDG